MVVNGEYIALRIAGVVSSGVGGNAFVVVGAYYCFFYAVACGIVGKGKAIIASSLHNIYVRMFLLTYLLGHLFQKYPHTSKQI